jgi:serine/threonine protein kinase
MAAHRNYGYTALLSENNVYFVWNTGLEKAVSTKFKSFVEIFSYYFGITYRKIDRLDESVKSLSLLRNKKYEQNFKEMHFISSGFFGIVCKAEAKNSSEIFAFKKIPSSEEQKEKVFKEIEIMARIRSHYLVECLDVWLEENYYLINRFENYKNSGITPNLEVFNSNKTLLLHIQMELCYKTLKDIII